MNLSRHVELLTMAISMWTLFFIAGLPSRYFLDWPWLAQLTFITVIPTFILCWITWRRIVRGPMAAAAPRAWWTAFYFTAPFLALDTAYLGLHLRLGASFLASHWYLAAFYVTPWLTLPILPLLRARRSRDDGV